MAKISPVAVYIIKQDLYLGDNEELSHEIRRILSILKSRYQAILTTLEALKNSQEKTESPLKNTQITENVRAAEEYISSSDGDVCNDTKLSDYLEKNKVSSECDKLAKALVNYVKRMVENDNGPFLTLSASRAQQAANEVADFTLTEAQLRYILGKIETPPKNQAAREKVEALATALQNNSYAQLCAAAQRYTGAFGGLYKLFNKTATKGTIGAKRFPLPKTEEGIQHNIV